MQTLEEWLEKTLAGGLLPGPFKPHGYYEPHGRSILVFMEGCDHYGDWINGRLTLFRACSDRHIIGFELFVPLGNDYIYFDVEELADLVTAPAWRADERNSLEGSTPSSSAKNKTCT